jgi:two-component system chemotaxis sensor kinase CheA
LQRTGYSVTTVASASEAFEVLESGENFDLIVSDIEMPGMDGFDFASAVKADSRWKETPMIALSSYSGNPDLARGQSVGFSDYVPKFDREALISSLSRVLSRHEEAA